MDATSGARMANPFLRGVQIATMLLEIIFDGQCKTFFFADQNHYLPLYRM